MLKECLTTKSTILRFQKESALKFQASFPGAIKIYNQVMNVVDLYD